MTIKGNEPSRHRLSDGYAPPRFSVVSADDDQAAAERLG